MHERLDILNFFVWTSPLITRSLHLRGRVVTKGRQIIIFAKSQPPFDVHRQYLDVSLTDSQPRVHFPIQISLDKPLKRNTPLTEPRYRFDKTNDDLLHNTLKDSLSNIDTNITTQDELEELAVTTLCDKLMKAVDTSTPKVYSRNDPKSPISQAIQDLIKEKRRLRRLYNNTQDPNTKSTITSCRKKLGPE